ncbi:hypothetical protein AB988_4355 [Acinetobacter baumannii]|nr:hypothetical protein AB988_4355 [Acinetobacter baumannii]
MVLHGKKYLFPCLEKRKNQFFVHSSRLKISTQNFNYEKLHRTRSNAI